MATTSVSFGKLEILKMENKESLPIPSTWGLNKEGQETTDLKEVIDQGSLLPLGGSEQSCGYKGYGLIFLGSYFPLSFIF